MSGTLSNYTDGSTGRDNNFNLIRIVAATLVLVSHSFVLTSGDPATEPLHHIMNSSLGLIAVDAFFFTSGFLVAHSLISRRQIGAFLLARVLRVYPALMVSILATVVVLGTLFSELEPATFFSHPETLQYLIRNSFLLSGAMYQLPGVFVHLPYPDVVNGSLWTLPWEVRFYLLLAFVGFVISLMHRFTKLDLHRVCLTLTAAAAIGIHVVNIFDPFMAADYSRILVLFFMGSAVQAWRHLLPISGTVSVVLLVLLAGVLALSSRAFSLLYCLVLPYIVLWLAYRPGGFVRRYNRLGDYSYGLYIYAFPVQQTMIYLFPDLHQFQLAILAYVATLMLAVPSWHLLERRFLALKPDSVKSS